MVLAGCGISHGVERPSALMGGPATGPGTAELGRMVCFQTRPKWFWELLVRLSEMCGSSSVGVPGAQREGGVGAQRR